MVRTTKGPAEKSQPKTATKTPGDSPKMANPHDLDDATWGQVEAMARSQNTTTDEVIRRAIVAQYGSAPATGSYHSGAATDPTL